MTAEITTPHATSPGLEPRVLARSTQIPGTAIASLGHDWTLAALGLARILTPHRDQMYVDRLLYQDVANSNVRTCAWYMLTANYDLTSTQAIEILSGADPMKLIDAVFAGIFVHVRNQAEETYTMWVRSSLLANNIDPASLEVGDIPYVLHQLVETNRAIPRSDFTIADQHAQMKRDLMKV
jgi:hypothetical protein